MNMRSRIAVLALVLAATFAAAPTRSEAAPQQSPSQPPTTAQQSPGASQPAIQSAKKPADQPRENPVDPHVIEATNDAFVASVLLEIKGHEADPASKVFKNVQWLTKIPARNLLEIMNLGYSRALGVTCTHCHNENDFSSDEKRPKRAAREMQVMHRSINDQLSKMQNLQQRPDHFINCSTCHRGMINPRQPLPTN
jgi:hypothetical protein